MFWTDNYVDADLKKNWNAQLRPYRHKKYIKNIFDE